MENASKALLIAGAILIVIILIGIGVAVINSTSNLQDQASSSANSLEVQAFNAQFTPYMGDSLSYNQVKKLISVIRASNSANGGENKQVYTSPYGMKENDVDDCGEAYRYSVSIDLYGDNGFIESILILPVQ